MSLALIAKAVQRTLVASLGTLRDSLSGCLNEGDTTRRAKLWADGLLDDAQIRLHLEGEENRRDGVIVMSNHVSLYDIPVLMSVMPDLRMITKKELFRVPIWGRAMREAGFIEIDRQNRDKAIESLKRAGDRLRQGHSIWVAPEGTRSRTGQLLPFKKGPFIMAIETGATILPVVLSGTRDVLKAESLDIQAGCHVRVRFLAPVDASRYTVDQKELLMAEVRTALEQGLSASSSPSSQPTNPRPQSSA